MTDLGKKKILLITALSCAALSILPIAAAVLNDVLYFEAREAERVAEQCPTSLDYWQCVSNDPRPISLIFIFFGLVGWTFGGLTCLTSRYLPFRFLSLLPTISILGCFYLLLRRGVADVTILGVLVALAALTWLLSPVIGDWLLGLYFRIRNRVLTEPARVQSPR
jgi:hypothetical protein